MEKKAQTLKFALFGPSKTGKSCYKAFLHGKEPKSVITPSKEVKSIKSNEKIKDEIQKGETVELGKYVFNILDLPGRQKFHKTRIKALSKEIDGTILFYDASDPASLKRLIKMVQEELIKPGYFGQQTCIVLLGNKIGNISPKAVLQAEKLKEKLSSIITSRLDYEVPHLLISSKEKEDVLSTFWLAVKIVTVKKIPKQILEGYSAISELKKLKKRQKEAEAPTPAKLLGYSLSLFPRDGKTWKLTERVLKRFSEVKAAIACRILEKKAYIAFHPGEPSLDQVPKNTVRLLIFFSKLLDIYEDVQDMEIQGENHWFFLVKRGGSLLLLQTEKSPSAKLKETFR